MIQSNLLCIQRRKQAQRRVDSPVVTRLVSRSQGTHPGAARRVLRPQAEHLRPQGGKAGPPPVFIQAASSEWMSQVSICN